LPWYTYPAINYLRELNFSEADILEFGGGHSTLWWSQRAKSVICLEANEEWCANLKSQLSERNQIHHVQSPARAAALIQGCQFDVIVVDDGSGVGPQGRADNAHTAFSHIKPAGLIIIDNSDADYSRPIIAEAHKRGWSRIDFIGFAPGGLREYCTSLFIKDMPERLHLADPPQLL
jgi:predicted O-methyltransferase YrrM